MDKADSSTSLLPSTLPSTVPSTLPSSRVKPKVYWPRWYILVIVALSNCLTNALWSTWGPVAQSAKAVYKWDSGDLSFIINSGNIGSLISTFAGSYLVDRKGIRISMVLATLMLALATGLRVISMDPRPATYLIAAGQFLGGWANSVTVAIPPVLSEVWFPVSERATATAIAALSSSLGAAVSFLLGPQIVSEPTSNGSVILYNETDVGLIRHQILVMNYIEFGWGAVLFAASVLYLPGRPPNPPSVTASLTRYNFKAGLMKLIKKPSVWHIAVAYSVPLGTFGTWMSILDTVLHPMGISQTEAGYIGFYSALGGVVAGIVIGRLADRFKRRLKLMLICNYIAIAILLTIFSCIRYGILPKSKGLLYTTSIGSGVLFSSGVPLFLELTCETSYPVAEGLTAGLLGLIINLMATIYLFINMIPNIGTGWLNWVLVGITVAAIPFLMIFKENYQRMDIDTGEINQYREEGRTLLHGPEYEANDSVQNSGDIKTD